MSKLEELIYAVSEMPGIKVRGLMTVPPFSEDSEQARGFANMYKLFIDMRSKKIDNISMDILSMGMSGDYCQAIEEGSTLFAQVRQFSVIEDIDKNTLFKNR